MPDSTRYFATNQDSQTEGAGNWVTWKDIERIEMVPGLNFQPVLGDRLMVNFVAFEPNTVAPIHWHEEEQITFVIDGEFEFEVAGEKRILRRGDSVVIPPNVPHGARTYDSTCLEVDAFHPPRRGLLEAMGIDPAKD
ncbi:MAG TPA: cupin domain-containing protein [Actinomycetota bacterium]|nr:cupin domain-containing protein [Actinomycetota bacterium]